MTSPLHRQHACSPPEAKQRLAPYVREIARSYGLRIKWMEDVCYFDGPVRSYLEVMAGSILLLANFTLAARLFKTAVEEGIIDTLNRARQ